MPRKREKLGRYKKSVDKYLDSLDLARMEHERRIFDLEGPGGHAPRNHPVWPFPDQHFDPRGIDDDE